VNIILFGPPGAGKGTQAQHLVKKYNHYQLSTGNLLRNEIENKTNIGSQISELIGRGEMVTDDIVDDLILNIVKNRNYESKIIFDGYPRNIYQAKNLSKILNENNQKINLIIFLNLKRDEVIKRIENRVTCSKCNKTFNKVIDYEKISKRPCCSKYTIKRADDKAETIIKRYDTYMKITEPVLKYYSSQVNFKEIDGSLKIDEISSKIDDFMRV
jgi:adenylate kinase